MFAAPELYSSIIFWNSSQEINAGLVQPNHLDELLSNRAPQLLGLGRLPTFLKLRPQRFKIDLAQVDVVRGCR